MPIYGGVSGERPSRSECEAEALAEQSCLCEGTKGRDYRAAVDGGSQAVALLLDRVYQPVNSVTVM